jgi:trehalose synthase
VSFLHPERAFEPLKYAISSYVLLIHAGFREQHLQEEMKLRSLDSYHGIVNDRNIYEIYQKARSLYGKHLLSINSTYQGGGVAEMSSSMVPIMNDIGIDLGWRIFHGNPDFFTITKKFHNALQGEDINLTQMKKRLYVEASENFSTYTHIDHDCVIIHDPQPLPLIRCIRKRQPWVWRCHVDLSNPRGKMWQYLKKFILRYDMMVVSNSDYIQNDLPVEQRVIHPAIDPFTPKNMEISGKMIEKYLNKFGIPTDKPLITQISRFDKWKDPEGVLRIFEEVKKEIDCRLVLCGSMAADDPEGMEIFSHIECALPNLFGNRDVILITSENNILVNALQRHSDVILQKSLREGFGLTVTEALWKERPVIASNVGGIPLQIADGVSGFLIPPNDTKAWVDRIIHVLENPDIGKKLGREGKRVVRERFLIPRLICDWLNLLNDLLEC